MQQAQKSRLLTAFLSALSITVSFGLAFYWNLDKPFWAGFSAMVVSLSTIGQSVQKGVLRMVGTVAGAVAGLFLLALWGQERWPLLVMLGIYILIMVFWLLRSRQSSYFFYTSAIVAVLIVVQSRGGLPPFQLAVARLEETLLGIAVYTVLALIFWPRSSLDVLAGGVFALTAQHGRLLAAQRAALAEEGGSMELGLYREALNSAARVEGLLPAARLESYDVRHNVPEWTSFIQLSRNLINMQQDFLLRLERLTPDKRRRFFPELDADLDALARQFAALAAWRPPVRPGEDAPPPPAPSGTPANPAEGEQAVPGQEGTAPGETGREEGQRDPLRRELELHAATGEAAPADALDDNAVRTLRENFARQSQLCVALAESLRFLLDRTASRADRRTAQNASEEAAPPGEWFTLAQLRQVFNAAVLYWLSILVWIYVYPPGSISTAFVEMSIMVGLVGFLAGRIDPVQMMVAFALGCVVAGLLYFGIMPSLVDFRQLGLWMFGVSFLASYLFYLPAQGMMRTGVLLPWFALSGLTNAHAFDALIFLNGALTLMLCASLIALVFYLTQGGHPARLFRIRQRRFLRAAVWQIRYLATGGDTHPFRHPLRALWAAWTGKLVRDLPPELMNLAFTFNEEAQGLDRQSVKLLALDGYGLSRRIRAVREADREKHGGLTALCLPASGLTDIPEGTARDAAGRDAGAPDKGGEGADELRDLASLRGMYADVAKALQQLPPDKEDQMQACVEFADALQTYLTSAGRIDWPKLAVEAF